MRSVEQARVDKLDVEWLISTLKSAQERGFYGEIVLKLENGSTKRIETKQSFTPPHHVRS